MVGAGRGGGVGRVGAGDGTAAPLAEPFEAAEPVALSSGDTGGGVLSMPPNVTSVPRYEGGGTDPLRRILGVTVGGGSASGAGPGGSIG